MTTRIQIGKILTIMSILPNAPALNNPQQVDQIIELYFRVLGHLDSELLENAATLYMSTATFFPTPGDLSNKALDLQTISLGVPTAAEAWAHVVNAYESHSAISCQTGIDLYSAIEGKTGREYWNAIREHEQHINECSICKPARHGENYGHPIVAEVVRMLGGRETILTDNLTADRSQFIKAYQERVAKEIIQMSMSPTLLAYVEEKKQTLLSESNNPSIKQLTMKMEGK